MGALSAERMGSFETWDTHNFTLKSGTKAYKGAAAVVVVGEGVVAPATSATGRVAVGTFAETVDATSAAKTVAVKLNREITVQRYVNDVAPNAVATTDLGRLCYFKDDQTVSASASGKSLAGRVWDVDSTKGVAVEVLSVDQEYTDDLLDVVAGATLAFVAADCAVTAAQLINNAVFDVPTAIAASTITLAVTDVPTGTHVTFLADGTKNAYGVTIRYGTTAITPSMPASTQWAVECWKVNATTWVAQPKEMANVGATLAFAANDCVVTAAQLVHETVFTCPATDAASTITLTTASVNIGTRVFIVFDGTANDFDVQIRYGTTVVATVAAGSVRTVQCIKATATTWQAITEIPKPILGGAAPDESSNDVIVTAAEIIHDAVYTLPTLDANSTVTLPVTGVADGTRIWFAVASPGAYTVTYRYGTTAITAALTANKGHMACCTKLGSAWYALTESAP